MAPNAPKFQSMRFTSFGASTTGASNNNNHEGKRGSGQNNAQARKPAAPYFNDVTSYPPLPAKKRGSAVQAVQEAAAAASRLEHQNQAQDAQSRQDQDQQHKSDGPLCDAPPTNAKEQPPVLRSPPKLMEGAKLQVKCAALEQQLQHHQTQAVQRNNQVHASLLQLLDALKLQGFEVAAALDSLQDDLCEEEAEGSEQGSEQMHPQHTSTSAAKKSPPLANGSSAHEPLTSSSEHGQPEKLVMLRAKRDHLEMEFISLMRTSVMGLERLLTTVQAQH